MKQSAGITTIVPEVRLLALGLAVWLMGSGQQALAQSGSPTIVTYKYERRTDDGRRWLALGWEVRNVDRVVLLHDGERLSGRFQLPDGSAGWPATMPMGGFRTTALTGTYTLVAENLEGRVEARVRFAEDSGCFVWLVPPGDHWSRCRKGGVIAADLSPTRGAGQGKKMPRPGGRNGAVIDGRAKLGFDEKGEPYVEERLVDGTIKRTPRKRPGVIFMDVLPLTPPTLPTDPARGRAWVESHNGALLDLIRALAGDDEGEMAKFHEGERTTAGDDLFLQITYRTKIVDFYVDHLRTGQ